MKTIQLFLILFMCNFLTAQENTSLKVSESEPFPETKYAKDILAVHRSGENETLMVRRGKRIVTIDIFNKDLKRIKNRFLELSRKERFIGEFFNDGVLKIFTVLSPDKKTRVVNCYFYDQKKGFVDKKVLFQTTVEKKRSLFRSVNKRQTNFAVSPNGKYFVLNTDNIKKNINSYTARVFDSNSLELKFERSYQTKEDKYFEHNDLFLDDNMNVYTLGKSFLSGKRQRKKNKANYTFILNKVSKEKEEAIEIKLIDEHIQSLTIREVNNQFHLLGFYSNRNAYRVKGYCDFVIDTDKFSIGNKVKEDLPNSVYTDLYGKDAKIAKSKSELANFEIDHVLTDSQGNFYIVSEEFYVTYNYVPMGQFGGTTTVVYHYDDIFVLKLNPQGKLMWGRSIFKRSTAPSYNVFLKNDELYVLLNSGKRLVKKDDGRTKVSQGLFESSALYNIIFKEGGKVVYEKIQDNKKKTKYLPFFGTYDFDRFIMPSNVINKKKFLILE